MKTILIFAALLAFTSQSVMADPPASTVKTAAAAPPAFKFIRGHRQGATAAIMWGVTQCNDVIRYEVYATYQDPSDPYSVWDYKGNIASKNPHLVKFTDRLNIYPGYVNYKIVAVCSTGNVESPICTFLVSLNL